MPALGCGDTQGKAGEVTVGRRVSRALKPPPGGGGSQAELVEDEPCEEQQVPVLLCSNRSRLDTC